METIYKIKDMPFLQKTGGFIINTDDAEYQQALMRKRNAEKLSALETRVDNIEKGINRIVQMLEAIGNGDKQT